MKAVTLGVLSRPGRGRCHVGAAVVILSLLSACSASAPPRLDASPSVPRLFSSVSLSRASLRGLCAVDARVAWTSGSGGAYGCTRDGGTRWTFNVVPGARMLDFRDVVAFDANRAWLMSAGPGGASRIYRTDDGGRRWRMQWKNPHTEGFLDGMDAWDDRRAIAYGDPVGGHMYVLRTDDGGRTWRRPPTSGMPRAHEGEAGFAASGTGVQASGSMTAWIATGGAHVARVFRTTDGGVNWSVAETPLGDASASSGIFSFAFKDADNGVAVGGDYVHPARAHANAAWTDDGGRTWHRPDIPPRGYRSGVAWLEGTEVLVCVGPTGTDVSTDAGRTWRPSSDDGYHGVRVTDGGGYASGSRGRLAALR